MKQNILAAALSAILPGAGQIYTHHWAKGAGFLIAVMMISAFIRRKMLLTAPSITAMVVVTALFGLAIWSVVDAYRSDR